MRPWSSFILLRPLQALCGKDIATSGAALRGRAIFSRARLSKSKDNSYNCCAPIRMFSRGPPARRHVNDAATSFRRTPEETLVVAIDQALIRKVPAGTGALAVGNAAIADLTLLKQGAAVIITSKGFGETNFIALDAAGRTPGAIADPRCRRQECLARAARDGSPILCLRAAMSANREARRRCRIFQGGRQAGKRPQRASDRFAIGLP